jgi:hypothetical protein
VRTLSQRIEQAFVARQYLNPWLCGIVTLRVFGGVQKNSIILCYFSGSRRAGIVTLAAFKVRRRMIAEFEDTSLRWRTPQLLHGRGIRPPLETTQLALQQQTSADAHGLRISPPCRWLLAEFVLPNAASVVAQSPYWRRRFREPVVKALAALKDYGLLIEPHDPHARMCHERDESDLRSVCLECGLEPTGSAEQLAARLLTIDPSGWLLGYPGELLQCSELAVRAMCVVSESDRAHSAGASDDQVVWGMLQRHAQQTARERNLARCRNVHLAMANYLLRRNKPRKALQALCIVCAFDLCGARNCAAARTKTDKTNARFDATHAALAPWLVLRVKHLCRDMEFTRDEIRAVFVATSSRLPIPRDSLKLWAVLQLALEGALEVHEDAARRSRVIQNLLDH